MVSPPVTLSGFSSQSSNTDVGDFENVISLGCGERLGGSDNGNDGLTGRMLGGDAMSIGMGEGVFIGWPGELAEPSALTAVSLKNVMDLKNGSPCKRNQASKHAI